MVHTHATKHPVSTLFLKLSGPDDGASLVLSFSRPRSAAAAAVGDRVAAAADHGLLPPWRSSPGRLGVVRRRRR